MIHNLPQSLIEAALQVLESTLLEGRIDFLKDKNQEIDTSHDALAQHRASGDIIDHLATHADPTKKKTYTQWILGQYKAKNIRQEDVGRVHSVLTNFEKYKSRLTNKDINQYDTINAVSQAIHPHLGTAATRTEESQETISKGRTLVHDNGKGLKVYRLERTPEGKKASQEIYGGGHELGGTHTSWCTAARSKDCMFDKYSENTPLHVIHTPTGNVYQAHPETGQLMDKGDEPITPANPDIKHVSKALDHIPDGDLLKIKANVPGISDADMGKAVSHKDYDIRVAAANHPDIKPHHIDKLIGDHVGVADAVARNPSLNHSQIDRILSMTFHSTTKKNVFRYAKNITTEHINKGLADPDVHVNMAAISHNNTTPDQIDIALQSPDVMVRGYAASHKNITPSKLEHTSRDPSAFVREYTAKNIHATPSILDRLIRDDDQLVRTAAVRNQNTTKEHLDHAINDPHYAVRWAVAAHNNATKEHLTKLKTDQNISVQKAVAQNKNSVKYGL